MWASQNCAVLSLYQYATTILSRGDKMKLRNYDGGTGCTSTGELLTGVGIDDVCVEREWSGSGDGNGDFDVAEGMPCKGEGTASVVISAAERAELEGTGLCCKESVDKPPSRGGGGTIMGTFAFVCTAKSFGTVGS